MLLLILLFFKRTSQNKFFSLLHLSIQFEHCLIIFKCFEEKVIKNEFWKTYLIICGSNRLTVNYNTLHYFVLIRYNKNLMAIIKQSTAILVFPLNTYFWQQSLLVFLSSDVKINAVLTRSPKAWWSICHRNLSRTRIQNNVKLSLLRPYILLTRNYFSFRNIF